MFEHNAPYTNLDNARVEYVDVFYVQIVQYLLHPPVKMHSCTIGKSSSHKQLCNGSLQKVTDGRVVKTTTFG